jgi:hypothetical protein
LRRSTPHPGDLARPEVKVGPLRMLEPYTVDAALLEEELIPGGLMLKLGKHEIGCTCTARTGDDDKCPLHGRLPSDPEED